MIRRSSSLPRYLTQNQIHSLFGTILSLRDRALFGLVDGYGLRVGEVVLLDRSDIDLERQRIQSAIDT